jgi:hypothetical protein
VIRVETTETINVCIIHNTHSMLYIKHTQVSTLPSELSPSNETSEKKKGFVARSRSRNAMNAAVTIITQDGASDLRYIHMYVYVYLCTYIYTYIYMYI